MQIRAETPPAHPAVQPTPPAPSAPLPGSTESPVAPVAEPSIDTTRREAPGPNTLARVQATQPKLPHERDESVDMTNATPDPQMRQAYVDVQRGLQDTGRGPVSDKAYQKL